MKKKKIITSPFHEWFLVSIIIFNLIIITSIVTFGIMAHYGIVASDFSPTKSVITSPY